MMRAILNKNALVRLITFSILAIGMFVYTKVMPRESFPDVKVPVVMVITPYIGVSPKDIEKLVTIPIETELASLSDMKALKSTSAEGASIITIEFEPSTVIEDVLQQVRDRVSKAKPKLPEDAEEPDVREVSFSDIPVVIVSLAGPYDEQKLKALGEVAEERLKKIKGVLDVKLTGGLEKAIYIDVDAERIANLGISLDDVINSLRSENINMPGGTLTSGSTSMLIRIPGDFSMASDIENVAVKRKAGQAIFVRDIAKVVEGFEKRQSYSRLNQETAISIGVSKRSGANILEVVTGIKDEMKELQAQNSWPENIRVEYLGDQSKMINDMVKDLENGILTALILVVFVLILFMGVANSYYVAASIPISMLLGIIALQALGFTLNMMVLFSLILVLGMLVDNGIVLIENIYRHKELGKSPEEAAVIGASEVGMAVTMSTMTTVAAFFPLVFWEGIMGQFMGYMPKTVIIVLLASLFTALFILPVMTSGKSSLIGLMFVKAVRSLGVGGKYTKIGRFPNDSAELVETISEQSAGNSKISSFITEKNATAPKFEEPTHGFMAKYVSLLKVSLRYRYLVVIVGFISLIITFVAYGALNAGVEFFSETEPNRAIVSVRAPDGTDLEATNTITKDIESILEKLENVDIYVADVGVSGGGDPLAGSQAAPQAARITVDFLPDENSVKEGGKVRVEAPSKTIETMRQEFAKIIGAEITISKEEMGPPVGAAIGVEVSGDDFDEVGEAALALRNELAKIDGVAELSDDYKVGRPEMRLSIDRGAAKRIGASTFSIANTVRTAINGNTATTLRDGEEEYDVVVRVDPSQASDLQAVMGLRVPGRLDTSPDTFHVPLSSVASFELKGGSGSIRHIDQDLVVTISGNVNEGENPAEVRTRVEAFLKEYPMPSGTSARLGGAADEQEAAQTFLGRAFMMCILLILGVLVAQFNSFLTPIIILYSVLLSLIGVLWGLVLTNTPFGIIMTGLGVISLAGVVVNNAIVLLDYVEQLRDEGMSMMDALLESGVTRFRPVMLTATTTVLGLIPMAAGFSVDFSSFSISTGSQTQAWWSPMAIAVIFGLVVATVLTLVMVPTLYAVIDDLKRSLERLRTFLSA